MNPLILITRPQEAATAFADDLRTAWGGDLRICVAPLLAIETLGPPDDLMRFQTLICTSAHAIARVTQNDMRPDLDCYAVGDATAEAMRKQGFDPIIGPGTAKDLAQQIIAASPRQPCLYLRGQHVAFALAKTLNSAGIETESAITYRQVSQNLTPDAQRQISSAQTVIAPVFSPRSAKLLSDALGPLNDLRLCVISPSVAQAVPEGCATQVHIAEAPDKTAMLDLMRHVMADAHSA